MRILTDTINRIVANFDISCVVIDCAPGAMPYSAAAATLATVPLLIGRNEDATYQQIQVLPRRFQEFFPEFQPAKQSVVINAVSVREYFEAQAKKYAIADWIPLTSDVIHETEGLPNVESLRMLLFENYVIDLIKKFLIGHDHLIPSSHDVLPEKWVTMLTKLDRIHEAPRMRLLNIIRRLGIPGGIVGVVLGIVAFMIRDLEAIERFKSELTNAGIFFSLLGVVALGLGVYAMKERARIKSKANDLNMGGPDEIFKQLKKEQSHRQSLEELLKLTSSI
jgi:hypothetical protein